MNHFAKKNPWLFIYSSFLFMISPALAQQNSVDTLRRHAPANGFSCTGIVRDSTGQPLGGATLTVIETNAWTISDENGNFAFSGIPFQQCHIAVQYLGHQSKTIEVNLSGKRPVEIILETDEFVLDQVEISAKSVGREVAERPVPAQVISVEKIRNQPASLIELLNRSAGIRIRQTGALGTRGSILINGFQNRAVRLFKDEIPLDYLGGGFDISLLPVNMLERIEVYKGVLPGKLGADALGGALNFVSRKSYQKSLGLSYEAGSYNTHRASLHAYYKSNTGRYFAGTDLFFNYSDNNYPVDVRITEWETNTQYEANVNLFHNRFRNLYTEVYGGITGTKWADELRLGLTFFTLDRQINYGSSMYQAIGAATNRQYTLAPTVRYRQSFFKDKLKIDQFVSANTLHVSRVDTAAGQYNWLGEFFPSESRRGELTVRGSLAKLHYSYYTSRTRVTMEIAPRHQVGLNAVFLGFSRVGKDPLGHRFAETGTDVLAKRAVYNKTVISLGLKSDLIEEKLSNQLFTKYYQYRTHATDADYSGNPVYHNHENHAWGVAEAIKFSINTRSFVRVSGEMALRMPAQDEIFGDGDRKLSNFALKPERSTNFNLGYRTDSRHGHFLEINTFYRMTDNLILLLPHNFIYSQSKNMDDVRGFGIEADGAIQVRRWLKAGGNFTVQDLRLHNTGNPSAEGARLRNTPYFFSNLSLSGDFPHLLGKNDRLQVYWHFQFVKQYFLDVIPKDKEPQGFLGLWGKARLDARNIIPDQLVHTVGLTYQVFDKKLSAGVQVKNLFDTQAYDNFRVQNMGRSLHLKLQYHISKN